MWSTFRQHPDEQLLQRHREGLLEPALERQLEAHLEQCEHCRGILQQYERLGVLLYEAAQTWKASTVPEDLSATLLADVLKARRALPVPVLEQANLSLAARVQTLAGGMCALSLAGILFGWSVWQGKLVEGLQFSSLVAGLAALSRVAGIMLEGALNATAPLHGPAMLVAALSMLTLAMVASGKLSNDLSL